MSDEDEEEGFVNGFEAGENVEADDERGAVVQNGEDGASEQEDDGKVGNEREKNYANTSDRR